MEVLLWVLVVAVALLIVWLTVSVLFSVWILRAVARFEEPGGDDGGVRPEP